MDRNSSIETESVATCAQCKRYRQIFRLTLAGWICKDCAEQIDAELEYGPRLEV